LNSSLAAVWIDTSCQKADKRPSPISPRCEKLRHCGLKSKWNWTSEKIKKIKDFMASEAIAKAILGDLNGRW
jgi:hypothetical protein